MDLNGVILNKTIIVQYLMDEQQRNTENDVCAKHKFFHISFLGGGVNQDRF